MGRKTLKLFYLSLSVAAALALVSAHYASNAGGPSATLSVTVVPAQQQPPPSGSVPAYAQAAGFTTLAANYDFSQPSYATLSNWLDLTNGDTALPWHCSTANGHHPCTGTTQTTDPVAGKLVLDLLDLSSYGPGNIELSTILNYCGGGTSCQGLTFPNKYVETVYRIDNRNSPRNGPDGVWQWQTSGGSGPIEVDYGEVYTDGGADSAALQWSGGTVGGPGYGWCNWGCGAASPSNYAVTDYHKYGVLYTSNGSSSTLVCYWVDDVFQSCQNANDYSDRYLNRSWLIITNGGNPSGGASPTTTHLYIQYISVWSCANWALSGGATWSSSSANQCNGSTLVNNGSLSYWR